MKSQGGSAQASSGQASPHPTRQGSHLGGAWKKLHHLPWPTSDTLVRVPSLPLFFCQSPAQAWPCPGLALPLGCCSPASAWAQLRSGPGRGLSLGFFFPFPPSHPPFYLNPPRPTQWPCYTGKGAGTLAASQLLPRPQPHPLPAGAWPAHRTFSAGVFPPPHTSPPLFTPLSRRQSQTSRKGLK